jgi:uncharacterized protein YhaN
MRLVNLSLEDWRGVDSRQLELSESVTLIEGPNEIGKSTVVEAVRMLFSEMDSSKKKHVKAIQPVGRDVGSTVKAEVHSGDYHFVYSKTYNKTTQTSLEILAPKKRQLTGREAHEEVERILGETVDMALWDALLVEQGEKVALANFQDSAGLAKALDEAAGSSSSGSEDTGLYEAVQSEYERYFTLKSGKAKFSALQDDLEKAKSSLDVAQQALNAVEEDALRHDRCADEVRRLTAELPELQAKMEEHQKHWTSIQLMKDSITTKQKELESAQALNKATNDANEDRLILVKDIELGEESLKTTKGELEPLRINAANLKEKAASAHLVINDLRQKVKTAKAALDLAQADEQQIRNLASLAREKDRLEQLDGISAKMKEELVTVASIKIDDTALEDFRKAERRQDIASGKRDSAATAVSVSAEKKLDLQIDDDTISLKEADVEVRTVASELLIRLPGVASIQLSPPLSVAELQGEADEAKVDFENLKTQFGVADLKEAESLNERRRGAQWEVDRLKEREEEILKGANREEIEQAVVSRQAACDSYAKQRDAEQAFPKDAADATARVKQARDTRDDKEGSLDEARVKSDGLQSEHEAVDSELRIAQQDLAGLEATLSEKHSRLKKARAAETDEALAKRVEENSALVDRLEQETNKLKATLAESSPASVEVLLTNAKDVYERAGADLIQAQQNLAVLADRLQQAQADGRFESMEAAERELEERKTIFESTHRRAVAAELLWSTLSEHRDAARQAYVRPLSEAIERLGTIVFGSGFEVELGDDWSLISRTLHGKTLPFDDLSVGAKEQLGILTRLAAAQIVSKQGGVPLIIDDALGFSDPSRLETMGAAIAAAGKNSQIIILTCTPGRFTHVGNANVVKF